MKVLLLFVLVGTVSAQWDTNMAYGRQVMVHLFEWKWSDIASECENFLGPNGFGGVQISPPYNHINVWSPHRPWWERYQPQSYDLNSRSGSESEFADMVHRCNNAGVRIYPDAVFNHMAAIGYDFPKVPFSKYDFNVPQGKCSTGGDIKSYQDVNQVRNCNLVGLSDLDLGKDYVRGKIIDYLNKMIDYGVAGFRIDACKHMWPGDLGAIYGGLNNLNGKYFNSGSRAFMFQEVIDQGGEPITAGEYTGLGRVTEFKYCLRIAEGIRGSTPMKHFSNFGSEWGMLSDGSALVFVDNHDNQRGHGGGGSIITHEESRLYKMATTFMMAHPYGAKRVMSSYYFNHNTDQGPPSDGSGNTNSVQINADGTCGGGWVCEHRWRQITNMAEFANAAAGQPQSNWWDNGNKQIAFGRGNKAFYVLNVDSYGLNERLYTGMPSGEYCNVITGSFDKNSGTCSGPTINVDGSGYASFSVSNGEDPMAAIHVNARVGDTSGGGGGGDNGGGGGDNGGGTPVTAAPPPAGTTRTVIFVYKPTSYGQDLFIRGGIDHSQRTGCTSTATTSACALPISHNVGGTNSKYNAWKTGDNYLDWYGTESGQGSYNGQAPDGTPLIWTTNNAGSSEKVDSDGVGYTSLNQWGDHYWMLDVNMNCDKTDNGWFELKAYLSNGDGWESDRDQSSCSGSVGGSKPYSTGNHFARCGYINVFKFNDNSCIINSF
ncbi:alpha-amylase 4N-like [Anneissia japonica]|uniref:alpha-amylase 4N-like n=1 Tax=Anneissia japonica TaxID=1529436 RepID=UPI0014256E5D|nr:alpha-amylase 4N-like [Anneissia japonica]